MHVSSILGKLGLQSRTQAALYAGRSGLVPVDQLGMAAADDEHPHGVGSRPTAPGA